MKIVSLLFLITSLSFIHFSCVLMDPSTVKVTDSRFSQRIDRTIDPDSISDFEPGGYTTQTYWSLSEHGKKVCWSFDYKYIRGDGFLYFPDGDNGCLQIDGKVYYNNTAIYDHIGGGVCEGDYRFARCEIMGYNEEEFPGPGLYYITLRFYDETGTTKKYTSPTLEVVE